MVQIMKYKGKYEAKVTINFDVKTTDNMRPIDEIKDMIMNELTPELKKIIEEYVCDNEIGTVHVDQLFADLYEDGEDGRSD